MRVILTLVLLLTVATLFSQDTLTNINTTAKYDSLMKKAKENISGGTAMTIAGAVCIPSGATILALSNGEPLFVGLGTGFLAIGVGFVIAGPILIHQSKKQRNAANELKRTAYLLPPSFNYAYNTKLDSRPSFTASLRIAF